MRASRAIRDRIKGRESKVRLAKHVSLDERGMSFDGVAFPFFVGLEVEVDEHNTGTLDELHRVTFTVFAEKFTAGRLPRGTQLTVTRHGFAGALQLRG